MAAKYPVWNPAKVAHSELAWRGNANRPRRPRIFSRGDWGHSRWKVV